MNTYTPVPTFELDGNTYILDQTFELDGKAYRTDLETLELLRSIIPNAKAKRDGSAVYAILIFGERAGRIVKMPY